MPTPVMPLRRSPNALTGVWAYPLPQPAVIRAGLAAQLLLSAALIAGWMVYAKPVQWQQVSAWLVLIAISLMILRMPLWYRGTFIQWTGSKWRLASTQLSIDEGAEVVDVVVAVDGQSWLLLKATIERKYRASGVTRWLLLVRASSPERWPDIRRVLYSYISANQHPNYPV